MNTDKLPQLKALWQQAFGDTDWFVDRFFETAYSPDRCRFLERDGKILSALYWFDCFVDGQKWAYLYAVATEKDHRGQGLCRKLMEQTHRHLNAHGYAGAVLVPAEEFLWNFYGKLGYAPFGTVREFTVSAGETPENVERISGDAYRELRKSHLAEEGVDQHPVYPFYEVWGGFYRGDGFLFAAALDGDTLYAQEFFGDEQKLPGILRALGAKKGSIRAIGGSDPCAMFLAFSPATKPPVHLGFALD